MSQLITPEVLRGMAADRITAYEHGEFTAEFIRGYLVALYHAGALEAEDLAQLLARIALPQGPS